MLKREENSLQRELTKLRLIFNMLEFEINKLYKESDFNSEGFKLHSKFSRDWWGGKINVGRYENNQIIYIVYKTPEGLLCPIESYNLRTGSSKGSLKDIFILNQNDTK